MTDENEVIEAEVEDEADEEYDSIPNNGVYVLIKRDESSVEVANVSTVGDVTAAEVPTVLKIAAKVYEERIGI